jgi:cell division protease FtsH
MGMVQYGEHEDYVFLGRDLSRARDYSEATAQEIDGEVRKLIDSAYTRAKDLLVHHRGTMEAIAKALLEYETLDGPQIRDIIKYGKMTNPPAGPTRPRKEPPPLPDSGTSTAPDFPHGLTEAPA